MQFHEHIPQDGSQQGPLIAIIAIGQARLLRDKKGICNHNNQPTTAPHRLKGITALDFVIKKTTGK